ncbi:putative transmembrane protein [Toxoplasma gondii RUB]|uniref:Putative transmembrane protein n=1 Tax=Toxoplasma gondii RUB TaxID=935652 RepID=A0A086LKT4_TOXGO|nr:putative transmembrane protein [Toxoplasma gondii RUB]
MSTPEEHRSPLVFSAPQSVSPYLSAAASSPFSAVHYAAPRSASVGGGPRLHAQKASDDSMRSHRAASAMPALQAAPGSAASHPKWVISRASVSPTPPLVRTSIDAVSDRAGSEDVARNRSDESLRGGIDGSETPGKKETPNFLRFLCLVGGLMNAGTSFLAASDVMHFLIDPATYALAVAQAFLGLIVVLREAGHFAQFSACQKKLLEKCAFLDNPVYKGLFYMYFGLVSLALRSVASLYTIPGSFIVATGFLCIFIQKTVEDETMKDNLEKVTALFTSPRH